MNKTILITTSSFGKFDQAPLESLQAQFDRVVLNPYRRKLTEEEVAGLIKEYQPVGMVAGVEPLTKAVLQDAENLCCISRAGIGMDGVDLQAAQDFNIVVTNTPDAPTIPVAELTIGMMFSLLRGIHSSDQGIRKGDWSRPMGRLLYGKTVGLVGCGRIGQKVAEVLSALGCNILGCDPVCSECADISYTELEILLKESDIVSLHLPYSGDTRHIINARTLSLMRKEAYLINASRGGLIDEQALYNALTSGNLAGAALDCFEDEPYIGPLTQLDNVLLTGHIGSYAREGRIFMEKQAVENLIKYLSSKKVV